MIKFIKVGGAALIFSVLVGVGTQWMRPESGTTVGQAGSRGSAPEHTAGPTVPITAARVQQHTVPMVLEGLGTVQPLNTATMHTQVQGTLDSVDFLEGQEVKRGQVLARIDPGSMRRKSTRRKQRWRAIGRCLPIQRPILIGRSHF
jgi:multidrug efflux system membrane fusion protein